MNPVVHFEMVADDRARVTDFYAKVFGWKMQQYGPEMGNYVLAQTVETDDKGMPQKPGAINGGFYTRDDKTPVQSTHVVISVSDLRAQMEKVRAAGGTIDGEPMNIPGIGEFVMIHDTEGNRVGMLQPVAM